MAGGALPAISRRYHRGARNAPNIYFLNPAGIVFGPAAHLNVTFSAYFSTAPELRSAVKYLRHESLAVEYETLMRCRPVSFGFLIRALVGSFPGTEPLRLVTSGGPDRATIE